MPSAGAIRMGKAFVEAFLDDGPLNRGLTQAEGRLKKFGENVGKVGTQLFEAGLAGSLPFALATKTFADFDDKMREVKAVSQSNDKEFRQLTETAKKLGATTSFTAVQVAGLMGELGRAGFAASQIEDMTGAVLDLSRATSTDAVLASGIMAATIRQFGLAASDSTRVADGLTQAANASFNSVESLGEALQYAGPVAAGANMSLEETLAILGSLGNVGIQGSEAGTALRRLITLSGAEAAKWKDIFGVDALDAAGNIRPLVDVLGEVTAATKDLPTGERAAKFNEAFGLLGITGASAIGKAADDTRTLLKGIEEAAGVASNTAKEMDAGIGGSFRILLSAVEGVAIAVGDGLAPAIKSLADDLTKSAGDVQAFVERNRDLIVGLAATAAGSLAAGAALIGISKAAAIATSGVATLKATLALAAAHPLVAGITLVAAAIALVGTRALNSVNGVRELNRALEEQARIQNLLDKSRNARQKETIREASRIENPVERAAFLREQLERAELNASGLQKHAEDAQRQADQRKAASDNASELERRLGWTNGVVGTRDDGSPIFGDVAIGEPQVKQQQDMADQVRRDADAAESFADTLRDMLDATEREAKAGSSSARLGGGAGGAAVDLIGGLQSYVSGGMSDVMQALGLEAKPLSTVEWLKTLFPDAEDTLPEDLVEDATHTPDGLNSAVFAGEASGAEALARAMGGLGLDGTETAVKAGNKTLGEIKRELAETRRKAIVLGVGRT